MAEEESNPEESEGSPIEELAAQAKKQLKILFAACASTIVFLICLGFTYMSLNGKILTVTTEPLMEMENLSGLVSDEYSNLNMAVEFYNHQMNSIESRLDAINPAIDQAQFEELKLISVSQEKDFQIFLNSAQGAMHGLSEMVTGSRGWRDDFKSKLDLAITTSEARELSIMAGVDDMLVDKTNDEEVSAP